MANLQEPGLGVGPEAHKAQGERKPWKGRRRPSCPPRQCRRQERSIHSQGVASSPSTTTTPPPPVAVQAPTTPASTPAAATRSASITEVDHGAANAVPHMDAPLTTKSLTTCSTYVPTGTLEGSVADAVQLLSGPRHAIAANKEDDPHELITDVGGVSLFLEPCVEPAEVVFSESHLMEQLPAGRVSRQWDRSCFQSCRWLIILPAPERIFC